VLVTVEVLGGAVDVTVVVVVPGEFWVEVVVLVTVDVAVLVTEEVCVVVTVEVLVTVDVLGGLVDVTVVVLVVGGAV